jgi:hypothetical protein
VGFRPSSLSEIERLLTVTFERSVGVGVELVSSINSARISARASRKFSNIYLLLGGTSTGTSSVTNNENTTAWTRANLAGNSFLFTTARLEPSFIIGDTKRMVKILYLKLEICYSPFLYI